MFMPHLEVSQSYFRVIGGKVIVAATHREVRTSKAYMILTWMLMWDGR